MKFLKIILPFLVIIFLSFWTIQPFFQPYFFPIHDDTQIARVFEMKQSLSDGMFPVRWVSDLGYHFGYPIFNFYAPLSYYVGGVINLLGADSLLATKMTMILGILMAGIFMYLFAKEFFGKSGGVIAALLYLYTPYHALDIYVRGDMAEFYAYAFIPLLFYGLWKSYKDTKWIAVIIGSTSYAAIILSHNLTALMVTPFVFVFAVILFILSQREKKPQRSYYPLVILFFGIIISAFYWLPVFGEMQYTNVLSQVGGGADYKDHYVCPIQLWDSQWGFGGSTKGCVDGLSFKLGKLPIVLLLLSVSSLVVFRKRIKFPRWIIVFSLVSLLFAIFLMLEASRWLWDLIPQMGFIQYPWRFLLVASFFISFLGAAGFALGKNSFSNKYVNVGLFVFLASAIVYFNSDVFSPQTMLKKSADDYTAKEVIAWQTSKISDEYLPKGFSKPHNANEVPTTIFQPTNDVVISSLKEKTQTISADVTAKNDTKLTVNLASFPAWHVFIDNQEVNLQAFNKGFYISLPAGTHNIIIIFIQTPLEKLANGISVTGFFILIIGILITKRKERKNAKST